MMLPSSKLTPSTNVFAREFDGELVLLDVNAGIYYGLDAIASHAWKGFCDGDKTLHEVASEMLAIYEVDEATLMKDIAALASEWVAKGLVDQVPLKQVPV